MKKKNRDTRKKKKSHLYGIKSHHLNKKNHNESCFISKIIIKHFEAFICLVRQCHFSDMTVCYPCIDCCTIICLVKQYLATFSDQKINK